MRDKTDLQSWLLLALLALIWGTSYILMKKGLLVFTPLQVASWRITLAGLVCLPFLRRAMATIPRSKYGNALFVGMIGSGLPAFLFAFAITRIHSSVGGMINSLSPLFTVLTGLLFWQIHAPSVKVLGILIGFIGALVLVFGQHGLQLNGDVAYAILPVIATFCYGTNSNYIRQYFPSANPVMLTVLVMCMIAVPALIILSTTGFTHTIAMPGAWRALAYISILGGFGTVVSNVLFYRLIQRSGPLFAASVTYLIPIVAIAWGVRDGEHIARLDLIGLLLILAGVYFVSRPGKNQEPEVKRQEGKMRDKLLIISPHEKD
jgi:drug/metabolite transporter (DMT)-like permease